MEKLNNSQIRNMFYERSDSKKIIKEVNKECLQYGIDNKKITTFINGEIDFEQLNRNEQITTVRSIFKITRLSIFDYEKLFSNDEIQESAITTDDFLDKYLELDYIGISSNEFLDDKKKLETLRTYDEYQLSKLVMLNDKYPNKSTKITYFTIYQTNLHYAEKSKEKDLMNFTTKEIENLIETLTYAYDTTRQNLITFINLYCEWAVEEGLIKKNPCSKINRDKIKNNPKIFLSNKIYGKTAFYQMIEAMEEKTKIPNVIPLILGRYGIVGKGLSAMINLKWEDIDSEKMEVNVNGVKIPIDTKFLEYMTKAKNYTESAKDGGKNTVRYSDFGYVLKKAFNENDEKKEDEEKTIKYATIFNRVNEACTSIGISRISFKRLLLSRQIEILLEMRKFGRLEQKDFEYVIELFDLGEKEPLVNRAFQLKKRWIELTGDLVVTQRKDTRNIPEGNSFKTYENLKLDLDLYL